MELAIVTLSHNDLLALNRAIGEIYTARDLETFYRSAFNSIQSIIPGEICSVNNFSIRPLSFLNAVQGSQDHCLVYDKLLPAFNTHVLDHPVVTHYFSDTVVKMTDHASRRRFKATAIYNEYYKHLDVETQIGFSIPTAQEKVSLIALSRKSPDYSDRDKLILTLLRPHLMHALRNATEHGRMRLERDLLQKGAEAEKQGAVLFQSDGTIICISPFAKEMLAKYFDVSPGHGDTLPLRLLKWFKTGESSKKVELETLTVEKEDGSLTIKLLNDFTTGDYIFVITEMDPSLILEKLRGYGLSCREAEVLTWLAKGKTNVEIAMILGMSKRTAEKHLEHVFAKLGVETRSAAAAVIRQ